MFPYTGVFWTTIFRSSSLNYIPYISVLRLNNYARKNLVNLFGHLGEAVQVWKRFGKGHC